MSDHMGSSDMEARLRVLEAAIPRIEKAMQDIAIGVQSLARLETAHQSMSDGLGRAFAAIEKLEKLASDRLEKIEAEMPTIKLARGIILWFGGLCMVVVVSFLLYKAGLLLNGGSNLPRVPVP